MSKLKLALLQGKQKSQSVLLAVRQSSNSFMSWLGRNGTTLSVTFMVMTLAAAALVSPAHAADITCTGTEGLTACEWAKGVDFGDITKAIGILVLGLVSLGLVIFGGRMIIAWVSGRRSGL